jgi:hypothetical protein
MGSGASGASKDVPMGGGSGGLTGAAYAAAKRAAFIASMTAVVFVAAVGGIFVWATHSMGADAMAGIGGVLLALTLIRVYLEYRKIVELLELVELCTSDPAALREIAEEQLAKRAGKEWSAVSALRRFMFGGTIASLFPSPSEQVVRAAVKSAGGDVDIESLNPEQRTRRTKLEQALAKVEARKRRNREKANARIAEGDETDQGGYTEEFVYDDRRSTHGTVARIVYAGGIKSNPTTPMDGSPKRGTSPPKGPFDDETQINSNPASPLGAAVAALGKTAGVPVSPLAQVTSRSSVLDIPEDPESAMTEYVETALMKVPDEILFVILGNATFGPFIMILVGVAMLIMRDQDESGLMGPTGTGLVCFGAIGVGCAYAVHYATRAALRYTLRTLVSAQLKGFNHFVTGVSDSVSVGWKATMSAVATAATAVSDGVSKTLGYGATAEATPTKAAGD